MKYKEIFFSIILTFLGVEITSFISLKTGLIQDVYLERGIANPKHIAYQGLKWRTEYNKWGAWHVPNAKDRHIKTCFDVTYQANNLGARDSEDYSNEFPKDSYFLLGDSFMEGFGLNLNETFAYKLQELSEKKVLNFATAYNTGVLQYYLIYENFGSKLPHDTVIMGLLPANDFSENDGSRIKKLELNSPKNSFRYRPYYDTYNIEDEYPIFYPKNALKRYELGRKPINNFIASQSIRLNLVRLFKNIQIINRINKLDKPRYYGQELAKQKAALFYIEKTYQLAKKNGVKKFVVFAIPDIIDFRNLGNNIKNREIPYWESNLRKLAYQNNDFYFVDGFKIIENNNSAEAFFLSCDGHWSELGASKSADLFFKTIKD